MSGTSCALSRLTLITAPWCGSYFSQMRTPSLWDQVVFQSHTAGREQSSDLNCLSLRSVFSFPALPCAPHKVSSASVLQTWSGANVLDPPPTLGKYINSSKDIGAYVNRKLYFSNLWSMFKAKSWMKSPVRRCVSRNRDGWRGLGSSGVLTDGVWTYLADGYLPGSGTWSLPRRALSISFLGLP